MSTYGAFKYYHNTNNNNVPFMDNQLAGTFNVQRQQILWLRQPRTSRTQFWTKCLLYSQGSFYLISKSCMSQQWNYDLGCILFKFAIYFHTLWSTYLFNMSVKRYRHVQQDLALLNTPNKILYSVFQLMCSLINLFWVTLPRLSQLLGCF